jgi:hypothetical protein
MAVNPNVDFTAGQVATADQMNRFPRGAMGYVFGTAGNITLNTTLADIGSASVTFTAVSGRLYKVTYNAQMQKVTTNGYIEITITNGAGTNIYDSFTDVTAGSYINYSVTSVITGLSGSVTVKARGIVSSGTATIFRNANNPTSFSVEDIGLS